MEECVVVGSDPNRPNTKYSVVTPKTDNLYGWFESLLQNWRQSNNILKGSSFFAGEKSFMSYFPNTWVTSPTIGLQGQSRRMIIVDFLPCIIRESINL